jgi:hypothetical protein
MSAVSRQTGWSTAAAMGAFSTGAVVSAAAGVVAGRLIDARGPRPVMTIGSVLGVVSVVAIAAAPNLLTFYAAWTLAGVAQAAVLYPPAFAALTGWYGSEPGPGPHHTEAGRRIVRLPKRPPSQRAILDILVMQILVAAVAELRGVDIEEFVFYHSDTKVDVEASPA